MQWTSKVIKILLIYHGRLGGGKEGGGVGWYFRDRLVFYTEARRSVSNGSVISLANRARISTFSVVHMKKCLGARCT